MSRNESLRRTIVKASSILAGSAAMGAVAPSTVLGANDRLNFGMIGVGGMGTGHVRSLLSKSSGDNIQISAISDVYKARITRAQELCKAAGQDPAGYMDYRELLEDKNVDAVLIATPDHWHSTIAIEAMAAGKHVYVEKPMTLTCEQAIELRNAQKKYKMKLQVGPNFTAENQWRVANEIIKQGRVGKVTWAQASYNRNPKAGGAFGSLGRVQEEAGPHVSGEGHIDWDMWLGHKRGLAPRIPWNPVHFFKFRRYWNYNGGVATDLLFHRLAPMLIALAGPNGAYPQRVNASGGLFIKKDGREVPDVFMMQLDYPDEYTIFMESVLTNNTQIPMRIFGQYGTIEFSGSPKLTGNGDFKQEFRDNNDGYDEVTVHVEGSRDLEGNFIDAIRNDVPLHCNVDLGATTMVAIKMAVESYRQNRTMLWDAEKEKVIPV